MAKSHVSRFATLAIIALVSAFLSIVGTTSVAQATQGDGGGGLGTGRNACASYPTKFYKTRTTIIGVMTLKCNSHWQLQRVGLVIARSGGGKPDKTFYQKPMRECSGTKKCVATFSVEDVRGKQKYWLTNEPQGTWVSTGLAWTSPNGTTSGSGEMTCSGGDYHGIACSSQTKRF